MFQSRRQPALPLCLCIWRRLRHHGDRLARGRGQDQVHELTAGPVQECYQLCLDHVDQRGAHSVLQRVSGASRAQTQFGLVQVANDDVLLSASIAQVCAIVSKTGLVERCDVRLIRANQESHDGHQEED